MAKEDAQYRFPSPLFRGHSTALYRRGTTRYIDRVRMSSLCEPVLPCYRSVVRVTCCKMESRGEDRVGWPGSGLNAVSVTRACTSCSDDCVGSLKGTIRKATGNLSWR